MVSIRPHRHDVARFLISRGAQADIYAAAAIGDYALAERIVSDDPENIRLTLNERNFPKRDPRSGGCIYFFGFGMTRTPHMIASQFGHTAIYDLLMQRSPAWLRLVHAAEAGDEALAQRILQQQSALVARLSSAAARRIIGVALRNNTRAIELLLGYGWPAGASLDNRQTALHFAAWHGNLGMVRSLLDHRAPVNVRETDHHQNPLDWALHGSLNSWHRGAGDYPAVVNALLDAGAEIPKRDAPLEATEEVLEVLRRRTQ
jgi:ankyrin repeat protein